MLSRKKIYCEMTLTQYAKNGDVTEIMEMFESGKYTISHFDNALRHAVAAGKIETIKAMVNFGCRVTTKHEQGDTVFHVAAASGKTLVMEYLISVLRVEKDKHEKCIQKCMENMTKAKNLLQGRGYLSEADVDTCQDIVRGESEKIENMKKSSVIPLDVKGDSPCHVAVKAGHVHIVKLFLTEHLKDKKNGIKYEEGILSKQKQTLLQLACFRGDEAIVHELLKEEWDIDTGGENALAIACKRGHQGIVKMLVEDTGNRFDVNESSGMGVANKTKTPLYIAALNFNPGVVKILIEHGCDINAITQKQETPISAMLVKMYAQAHTHFKYHFLQFENVITRLIQARCDLNICDSEGYNAFTLLMHITCATRKISCVANDIIHAICLRLLRLMLECGYDTSNLVEYDQYKRIGRITPMHIAVLNGDIDVVEILVEHGSDKDTLSNEGKALCCLVRLIYEKLEDAVDMKPFEEIMMYMIERECDLSIREENGDGILSIFVRHMERVYAMKDAKSVKIYDFSKKYLRLVLATGCDTRGITTQENGAKELLQGNFQGKFSAFMMREIQRLSPHAFDLPQNIAQDICKSGMQETI